MSDEINEIKRRRAEIENKQHARVLTMAGIPYVLEAELGVITNKGSQLIGRLGDVVIRHSGHSYYWVAQGNVPLAVAEAIYRDPAANDIRVSGDCTCPAPVGNHIKWVLPNGREVLGLHNKLEAEGFTQSKSVFMRETAKRLLAERDFSDDPASLGASGFIEFYHIDSALGLRVFADYLKGIV